MPGPIFIAYFRKGEDAGNATFTSIIAASAFGESMRRSGYSVTVVNGVPPAPCGYCRRCAVHDDPGGCTTVEEWEREHTVEVHA